ncbi:MAG TPA: bh protein [Thermoanaerobacterales bacterium]|jgi:transcription elongation factor Elf1|nr:bh protein [Thermoanaerobacterales bacterium]
MSSSMKAELFCLHCNKDTPHTVTYVGNTLESIKCIECGNEIQIKKEKLLENYAIDFIERILTKPHRMTEELEHDIKKFILSLPIRVVTKPYRIAREVEQIVKKDRS